MRNLWIINHHTPHPYKKGNAGLHLQLAREMRKMGWNAQIIAASTSHPVGEQFLPRGVSTTLAEWENTESLIVRSRSYRGNGLDRWINMAEFGSRIHLQGTLSELSPPELIVGRITNPLAAMAARRWARHYGVPFVLEISDIWPDTFVQLGAWSESDIKTKILRRVEKRLIRAASAVMSPLPGVGNYLREQGFENVPFYWVPNGIEVGNSDINPSRFKGHSEKKEDGFSFMYAGSLGNANAVDTIISAFDVYVTDQRDPNAVLEIVGSGPKIEELKKQADVLTSRDRIRFVGRIPPEELQMRLQRADALVANMRDLPLYKHGIALKKLFDYLLAARPVVFASNAMNNLVEDAEAGISARADDVDALAHAMNEMAGTAPDIRATWGENGREFVVNNYTYTHSAERFGKMVADLTKQG